MENRIDAVYARQSVDKKDSISIESQIEFCRYELRGESGKEYTDKGYSGKNTDRPKFQELFPQRIKGGAMRCPFSLPGMCVLMDKMSSCGNMTGGACFHAKQYKSKSCP
jgi:hypothetical protein